MRKRVLKALTALTVSFGLLMPTSAYATGSNMLHTVKANTTITTADQTLKADDKATTQGDGEHMITGDDLAKQSEQDTKLDGLVGEYKPTQAEPLPQERYSGWPLIGGLLNRLFVTDRNVGKTAINADGEDDRPTLDGTTIEKITAKWLDTSEKTLVKQPSTNTGLTFGARVDFSVSGQYQCEPGDVRITIPLNIFKDRFGKDEGRIDISVPEDPAKGAVLTYKRVDDKIVISNAQTIPAAYQGYFEVYWDDVVPAEVVSGALSAEFGAVIEVTTHEGNEISKTSNLIDAKIITDEKISSATKRSSGVVTSKPSGFTMPAGLNPDDYYYVDWYSYAYISGNQYFTVDVEDTPAFNEIIDPNRPDTPDNRYADGIIVGTTIPNATVSADRKSLTAKNVTNGAVYRNNGTNFFYHTYCAYPKEQFAYDYDKNGQPSGPVNIKQVKNNVNYTLITADSLTQRGDGGNDPSSEEYRKNRVTSTNAVATDVYREYPWSVPTGHFISHKSGVSSNGDYSYLGASDHIGQYPYVLNRLARGQDVDLTYNVGTHNYPYPWTCDESQPPVQNPTDGTWSRGGCAIIGSEHYGKLPVHVTNFDDGIYFNELNNAGGDKLTADDYEFTKIRVLTPQMYSYGGSSHYGWNYRTDSTVARPVQEYHARSGEGEWVHYATVTWGDDGLAATPTVTAHNGATANGATITFPQGARLTEWKCEYETAAAGILTGALATIRFRATDKVVKTVQDLMANSDTNGYTDVRNTAGETITQVQGAASGNPTTVTLYSDRTQGVDRLSSAAQSVWMTKTGTPQPQGQADKIAKQVRVNYSATVTVVTNQTSRNDYEEVMADHVLPLDESGTYYDLLPLGFRLNANSVSAPGLKSFRTVDNWRGSGRTMLIVTVDNNTAPQWVPRYEGAYRNEDYRWGQRHSVTFDGYYTWNEMKDIDIKLDNHIAYASTAPYLGTVNGMKGEPDNPDAGNNTYSKDATAGAADLMTGLVDGNDNPSVVYAKASNIIHARTYALTGLQKDVSSDVDGRWGTGLDKDKDGSIDETQSIVVPTSGTYKYRIRMENTDGERLKNIVFYDDLEAYKPTADKPDHGDRQWEGSFLGVDVEALRRKGIEPTVYYATRHVDLTQYKDDGETVHLPDLNDTGVWTTSMPANPAEVKAIAVDCRHQSDGGEFVLDANQSVQFTIRMRAPDSDTARQAVEAKAHAYNNVYMSSTHFTSGGQESNHYIHQDYTKLGLEPYNLNVSKMWDDDDDRDGLRTPNVTMQLLRNGEPYGEPVTLDNGNDWTHRYEYLPKTLPNGDMIEWTLREEPVPNGYQVSNTVKQDGNTATITATNRHEPDRVNIEGVKTWENETDPNTRPASITVWLKQDGKRIKSQTVHADTNGNWHYQFVNLLKNHRVDGKTVAYVYEVEEEYTEGYTPAYTAEGIVNTYYPYGDITLTKRATDTTDASKDTPFTFELTLRKKIGTGTDGTPIYEYATGRYEWTSSRGDREGTIENGGTVTIRDGETITVHKVPSSFEYVWVERDTNGFQIGSSTGMSGTVTSGGNHAAEVENVYTTIGSAQLEAKKTLEGRDLRANQFRFEVMDEDGDVIRSATNDKNGKVQFSQIGYTNEDVGRTYTYTIREVNANRPGYTYSTATYEATVTVVDNGDGTITATPTYRVKDGENVNLPEFRNEYHASGTVNLTAAKQFIGGDLSKKRFTFELVDAAGNIVSTATTDTNGEARFPALSYTEKNVGQTLTYTVREQVDAADKSIIWDNHEETVTVTVTDNGDGSLNIAQQFSNPAQPLVWTNQAANGGLKVVKNITEDEQTVARRDTQFPVEIVFNAPRGASLPGKLTVKTSTPVWRNPEATDLEIDHMDETTSEIEVKNNRIRIMVPAEGWIEIIDQLPGGTTYMVSEVASID